MREADRHRILPRAEIVEHNRRELVIADVFKALRANAPAPALPPALMESREVLVLVAAAAIREATRIDKANDRSRPNEDR